MPPETPDTLAPPDIGQTVGRLMPRLRAAQRRGWLIALAGAIAGVLLAYLFVDMFLDGRPNIQALYVAILPFMMGAGLGDYLARRAHEAAVIPEVAREFGLTYQHGHRSQISSFPTLLLPRQSNAQVDAVFSGKIGGRAIRIAEVKYSTSAKKRRNLLDFIVLEYRNIVALPAFFIVEQFQAEPGYLSGARHDVSGLTFLRKVFTDTGPDCGLWLTDPAQAQNPAFEPVIAAILKAEDDFGPEASLYSAMADGQTTWLTFRKTRDMFQIGGLFISRDSVLKEVQHAAQDFGLPLRLITHLLEIEATAARASLSP